MADQLHGSGPATNGQDEFFDDPREELLRLDGELQRPFSKRQLRPLGLSPGPRSHGSPAGLAYDSNGFNGAVDRMFGRAKQKFAGAIFIHAGAGFHSHQNEKIHLEACNDAALVGMKFLRAGASATGAVEASLRVLEDKEITNAGYGSNLSIDGTVECDATVVDHLGRSGACGAVPNIRNPICLAKLILDKSYQPLSLRRVPPNILVGEGARTFAQQHGIQVMPNECLVSKNAKDRFLRWQADLKHAEAKLREEKFPREKGALNETMMTMDLNRTGNSLQRDHANAIFTGTWNEGQPDSPSHGNPGDEIALPLEIAAQSVLAKASSGSRSSSQRSAVRSPIRNPLKEPLDAGANRSPSTKKSYANAHKNNGLLSSSSDTRDLPHNTHESHRDGSSSPRLLNATIAASFKSFTPEEALLTTPHGIKRPFSEINAGEDLITDTIGAIAIDRDGRIAAGSSSGGIGMKHRGRIGPAALVGVGTAVVPGDDKSEHPMTVATVTSGTGEHMATTMASQRCAERLFNGTRRGPNGQDIPEDDEDAILESFISMDFMNHPGVRSCNSVGAIGVMAVKKTVSGYYFYFAHNTDSFALASMGGQDQMPMCVMSRLGEGCQVARGARKITLG